MPKRKPSINPSDLLPGELWVKALSFLEEPKDLLNFSETCHTALDIVQEESLWRSMNRRNFVNIPNIPNIQNEKDKFIHHYSDFPQVLSRILSKIKQSLNKLHSEENRNGASENTQAEKLKLKDVKLLVKYINSAKSFRFQHFDCGDFLEAILLEPEVLKELLIKLFYRCEFNQFIDLASVCYENGREYEVQNGRDGRGWGCEAGYSGNTYAYLQACLNSLEEEVPEPILVSQATKKRKRFTEVEKLAPCNSDNNDEDHDKQPQKKAKLPE